MFPIELDVLHPMVQALGWALIHFIWQGATIGALFAAGRLLLRHARPQSRYLLGLGCMLLLLVAPIVTFTSLYQQAPAPSVAATAAAATAALAAATAPSGFDFGAWVEGALPWVVLAWLIGVVIMSGRVTINWFRLHRCLRVGVHELDDTLRAQARMLRHYFGIRRRVRVLESALAQVPTVFGWLKPVVLLPTSSLVGLTPAQLELVIAHEMGHIRRFDYLVNLFQVTVETLLFYHPVVAWISRHVREEREQCCDDLVVKTCGNRLEYAKALTTLETMRSSGGMAPALAATDGQLLKRIERIVCAHGRPRDPVLGSSGVLLLVAVAIILAGRMADPMAAFEAKRNLLADSLVSELRIGDDAYELFAPLDEARFTVSAVDRAEPAPPVAAAPVATATAPTVAPPTQARAEAPVETSIEAVSEHRQVRKQPAESPPLQPAEVVSTAPQPSSPIAESMTPEPPPVVADEPLKLASLPKAPDFSAPAKPGPVAIKRVSPDYPVRARIAGQRGFVEVEFSVRPDGRVKEIKVSDSWPRRVFDRAAIKAIRGWRFDPATLDGGEGARLTQRFDFNISQGSLVPDDKRNCLPVTGTRICRPESPTSLLSQEAHVDSTSH